MNTIPRRPARNSFSITPDTGLRSGNPNDPKHPPQVSPGASINPKSLTSGGWEEFDPGTETRQRQNVEISAPEVAKPIAPASVEPRPTIHTPKASPTNINPNNAVNSAQLTDAGSLVPVDVEVSVDEASDKLSDVTKVKYVKEKTYPDANYIRVDLPSLGIPYAHLGFVDVNIRPFRLRDLSKIYRANQEGSYTLLVDAINGTVDIDCRDLTVPDFNFLMYWHRLNSYPASPFTIDWTSKYGNKNTYTVKTTNLVITEMKMTAEEYAVYFEKGICIPTVRDLEVLQMEEMTPDQEFFWQRAQFMKGATVKDKIDALESYTDLSIEFDIQEFSKKIDHGVKESVAVIDKNFDPKKAPKVLRESSQAMREFLAKNVNNEWVMSNAAEVIDQAKALDDEATAIEEALKLGRPVLPKEEEVTLSINVLKFFPANK